MVPQYVGFVMWLALLVAIFYFVLIRPQQRRAERHKQLVTGLEIGDRVVTIGGLHGRVKALADDTASLELSSQVVITVDRSAIGRKARAGERVS